MTSSMGPELEMAMRMAVAKQAELEAQKRGQSAGDEDDAVPETSS